MKSLLAYLLAALVAIPVFLYIIVDLLIDGVCFYLILFPREYWSDLALVVLLMSIWKDLPKIVTGIGSLFVWIGDKLFGGKDKSVQAPPPPPKNEGNVLPTEWRKGRRGDVGRESTMLCSACGAWNPDVARYCKACGSSMLTPASELPPLVETSAKATPPPEPLPPHPAPAPASVPPPSGPAEAKP